jgi:hypothetical protein
MFCFFPYTNFRMSLEVLRHYSFFNNQLAEERTMNKDHQIPCTTREGWKIPVHKQYFLHSKECIEVNPHV